ncbi:MAG TPA: MBL fold metallo-hydrolase [Candidatus Paceibacterota bacterium]|nr:MBL fold metallo-hydrolase [Candidatus Paceibacterota bacterium]
MTIEWFGEGCFKITETGNRFSVLTELPTRESGLNSPRHKVDVIINIFSDLSDSLFGQEKKEAFLISNAGEYELKGNFIRGIILSINKNLVKSAYKLQIENIKVGYLGMMTPKEMTPEVGNFFSDADVILVPVGGGDVLDATAAAEFIKQLEPKIVIPMYYKIPGLKIKRGELDNFLKKMEVKSANKEDRVIIKSKDLENWGEEIRTIVLNAL